MILHHIFEKLTPCYDEVINLRFSQPQNMVDSFITLLRVLIVEQELCPSGALQSTPVFVGYEYSKHASEINLESTIDMRSCKSRHVQYNR
jgi:hypothetical protein